MSNSRALTLVGALAALSTLPFTSFAHPHEEAEDHQHSDEQVIQAPTMEVVFVLDTTGSMSGLISGAKQKIWQIADKMKSAKPTPNIKFGLIGYRDRGDAYVTKKFGLNDNIDEVYANLMQFQANGGGDEPESVNQALYEAVSEMQWNPDRDTLKTIFLVGDARPHMDYPDDVKFDVSCQLAQAKGILINTIQCGSLGGTASFWKKISGSTNGTYAAILQDGGSIIVDTQWDPVIQELNIELDATIIPYGTKLEQSYAKKNRSLLSSMTGAAMADRSSYLIKAGKGKAIAGDGDLVELIISGKLTIETIDRAKLPPSYQKLDEEELQKRIQDKIAKRQQIQANLVTNVAKRNEFIEAEMEKLSKEDQDEVFELSAFQVIEAQAEAAGYSFEK
ncbi:VWA domain-containing protein [Pelagicoccus mobilis]